MRLPWGLMVVACGGEPHTGSAPADVCSPEALTRGMIYGGQAAPAGFSLSAAQALALVAVAVGEDQKTCSGVVVESGIVLTAAHCAAAAGLEAGGSLAITLGESMVEPLVTLAIEAAEVHPNLDVAALRTAPDPCSELAEPIPLHGAPLDASWVGATVEIAGFGWTNGAQPTLGQRFFASETVVDLELDHLVVESPSASSGACTGDSGGPALAVVGGQVVVLGTLDDGDASCLGRDYFVRVDRFSDWLIATREAWRAGP